MSIRDPRDPVSRRSLLAGALMLPAALALASCRAPQTIGRANGAGFAAVSQAPALEMAPVAQELPDSPVLNAIRQRGHLMIAGSETLPGFSLRNPATGEIDGFDFGIAQLLAKYILGKPEVRLAASGSDTREALLQNHTVDAAISTYTITEKRSKLVAFAGPYLVVQSGVAVRKDFNGISSVADLAGRDIAVQPGAAEEALKKGAPEATPVLFEDSSQCFTAVQQGRVDAWAANSALLLGKTAMDSRVRMTDVRFGSSPFGIGLPKDDAAYKAVVNTFLDKIIADGTWKALWENTIGVISNEPMPDPAKSSRV